MLRAGRSWSVATIVAILGLAETAAAQLPVCPAPEPERPVYATCLPGGRYVVVPLLANLAIDQLLRVDGRPIERRPRAVLEAVADAATMEKEAALADYLGRLPALELRRLDTATGTLRLEVPEEQRRFTQTFAARGGSVAVGLELPQRLEGGYWRTPGVLQMTFFQGRRAALKLEPSAGPALTADVECVSVSADELRIVTAGDSSPDILVRFDACE